MSDAGSVWLDIFRAGAATFVMIGHVRGLYLVDYASAEAHGALMAAFYFATGLGHQAVMVFFVLSGYFIAASVLRAFWDGRWSWRWYAQRRWTRLTIVLWPALALGAFLDGTGSWLFGAGGPYGATEAYRHIVPVPVADRLGWETALGNALYLQEIAVPTFGSNGPLWSLSYEFWYYALFPALLVSCFGRNSAASRLAHALAAAAIATLVGERILFYFAIWILGVAAFLAPVPEALIRGGWPRRIALVASGTALLAALVASKTGVLAGFAADLAVAAACAFLVALLQVATGPVSPRLARLAPKLAGFSYTLYLAHLPLLVFGAAAIVAAGGARWQPNALSLAACAAIAAAVMAYAYGLSRLTEAKTAWLRVHLFGK